jgi:MFS family permease
LSQIWAALMVHSSNYNLFIVSRVFGAFFGITTALLGPGILVDLFFLHQRGRAFTVFHCCFNFGTVAGPTLSAFVSAHTSWTGAYWWTAGLVGGSLVPVFLFLDDTSWNRATDAVNVAVQDGFFANRIALFCPGTKVTRKTSTAETVSFIRIWVEADANKGIVEGSQYTFPNHGLPCDTYLEYLHSCPLWILRCVEFPLASMVAKAYRSWRVRILRSAERNLSVSLSPGVFCHS